MALRDIKSLSYFNKVLVDALEHDSKLQQDDPSRKIVLKKINTVIKKYKSVQGIWKGEITIDNQIKSTFSPYYCKGTNEANYT